MWLKPMSQGCFRIVPPLGVFPNSELYSLAVPVIFSSPARGIAAFCGPALAGQLADLVNWPLLPFYLSSGFFILACIVFTVTGIYVAHFKRDQLAETRDSTSDVQ